MRKVSSTVLLLLAYLLFLGGGFETRRALYPSGVAWGIALSLGGQVALFVAGDISRPKIGKVGSFRAVAFTMFVLGSLNAPVVLFRMVYWKLGHQGLFTSFESEFAWGAAQAFGSIPFLLISTKRWKLLAIHREQGGWWPKFRK